MLRVGKLTDYATVILTHMAKTANIRHVAMELAKSTGISLPTVSKILKILVKTGIVGSIRGAKGGYILVRSPTDITISEVIAALEGPITLTECSTTHHNCAQATYCGIKGNWSLINQAINNMLNAITLADMAIPKEQLSQLIQSPTVNKWNIKCLQALKKLKK